MDNAQKLKLYEAVLEDIRDHLQCDEIAHRCDNPCYSCIAARALEGLDDPWEQGEPRNAPFQVDEMPAGRYYALISGYHDHYGVGFELVPTTAKVHLKAKSPWDIIPKNGTSIHAYCKDKPSDKMGNPQNTSLSAGALLEIEILSKGGYNIIKQLR